MPDTEQTAQSTPFERFAQTAERIGSTTKRLQKAAFLGDFFASLNDDDLAHAARYFAGYRFPLRDQRTTSVGGSALFAAVQAVSGMDPTEMSARLVRLGDMGDLAMEAFSEATNSVAGNEGAEIPNSTFQIPHSISGIADALDELAATSGSNKKRELAVRLLEPATPLEAKYIVKLLAGDLRIGLLEGAVEDAVARWAGVDVGRVQWANMLLGDVGETAVRARNGTLDQARMSLFHPLKFMLATPAADLADVKRQMPAEFIVEDKFDGIRAQAHIGPQPQSPSPLQGEGRGEVSESTHGEPVAGRRVALFSRTLDEITESFPDLLAPLSVVLPEPQAPACLSLEGRGAGGEGLIFDGEIVAATADRILPFQDLQQRLRRKTPSEELRARIPVAFVAYDILYGDGRILIDEPWDTRRALLERYIGDADTNDVVRLSTARRHTDVEPLDDEFTAARGRGNEGLMVKDPGSTYKPGRRGREWLKIKRALATLDVVVTAVEVGHGGRRHLLSDYTFAVRAGENDPALLNVGKAYSGLTDAELAEMSEWFRAHTLQEFGHGRVRIVEPKIVIEVTFDRVQASTRHKSGYALRFPRIVRLRPDKPVQEIDTLDTVKRIAESLRG